MFYKVVRRDLRNNFVEHHFLWKNFCYEENPYEPGPKKSQKATFYWATLYKDSWPTVVVGQVSSWSSVSVSQLL